MIYYSALLYFNYGLTLLITDVAFGLFNGGFAVKPFEMM